MTLSVCQCVSKDLTQGTGYRGEPTDSTDILTICNSPRVHGPRSVSADRCSAQGFTDKRRGPASVTDDAYLPLRALVAYSGLGLRTLRGYLHHPAMPLPHYRVGGKILIRRSEFDAWIARFRVADSGPLEALVADAMKGL